MSFEKLFEQEGKFSQSELKIALAKVWADPNKKCVVCQNPGDHIKIFVPENSLKFSVFQKKERLIGFFYCKNCHKQADFMEKVEDALFKKNLVELN